MSDSTFDDESMATASVQGSTWSFNSSGDISQFMKEENGRMYNTLNELYFLPSDNSEWSRLDKQHTAFYLALEGLYPCPQVVREILKPSTGISRDILDLGCGTGVWAIEMAKEFPHANVIGVDVVPVPLDTAMVPQNVTMEVYNINLGLPHFHGRFDLVHLRCVKLGVQNYEATIKEAEMCLKPGGMLIALEIDGDLMAEDQKSFLPMATEANPDGSMLRRTMYEVQACARAVGGAGYLNKDMWKDGLWDHEALDPATCGAGSIYLPIGPWPKSMDFDRNNRLKFGGALMRQNLLNHHHAYYPLLQKINTPQEITDEWRTRGDEELIQMKYKSWLRAWMVWGRKRLAEGLPAPRLGVPEIYIPPDAQRKVVVDSRVQRNLALAREPHQVEVYYSQEELKRREDAREAVRGPFPSPLVLTFLNISS